MTGRSDRTWACALVVCLSLILPQTVNAADRADFYALAYTEVPINESVKLQSTAVTGFTHPSINLKIPERVKKQKPQLIFEMANGDVLGSVLLLTDEFVLLKTASSACGATRCPLPPNARYAIVQAYNLERASNGAELRIELITEKVKFNIDPITGWYASIVGSFGGEKIADNPDGDPYRAGGGGRFYAGYIFDFNRWYLRSGLGLRYQGGVGESTAVLGHLRLSGQLGVVNLGLGLVADSGGKIISNSGEVTKFNPVITPELFLEYPAGDRIDLGVNFLVKSDYTEVDSDNRYQGPNIGLYIVYGKR